MADQGFKRGESLAPSTTPPHPPGKRGVFLCGVQSPSPSELGLFLFLKWHSVPEKFWGFVLKLYHKWKAILIWLYEHQQPWPTTTQPSTPRLVTEHHGNGRIFCHLQFRHIHFRHLQFGNLQIHHPTNFVTYIFRNLQFGNHLWREIL